MLKIFQKWNLVRAIPIGFVVGVLLVGLTVNTAKNHPNTPKTAQNIKETARIELNGAIIEAEVVDTLPSVEKGLGGKETLPEGKGMWFVFPYESNYGIWMKEMKFPIDIIWVDKNFRVVSLKENITPETYPEVFYPEDQSLYVLETGAGFIQKHKIRINDPIKIIISEALKN